MERVSSFARRLISAAVVVFVAVASALALGPAPSAHAVTCTKTWNAASGTWNTAASWAPAGVPTAADDVCIQGTTTYTVTITDTTATAKSVTVGGSAGNQTLLVGPNCSANASLTLANTSTINARGRLTLDSTACSNVATLTAPAGKKLINAGIVTTQGSGGGGARNLDVDIQQNAGSTMNVNITTAGGSARAFTNAGTINVAAGQVLDWQHGTFTHNGGAIAGTGYLRMSGGTFTQGNGTTTGTPPQLEDTNIVYAGTGASTLTARGDTGPATLSGNIGAAQRLNLYADCSRHVARTATASFTNAGTIVLDSVACSNNVTLLAGAGVTLTNTGAITTSGTGGGGTRNLMIDVVNTGSVNVNSTATANLSSHTWLNQGALNIADSVTFDWNNGTFTNGTAASITTSGGPSTGVFVMRPLSGVFGTFNQGTGTTAGIPLQLEDTNINYTGAGASTITARGDGSGGGVHATISGNVAASQTLNLYADCARHSVHDTNASFTNAGTINLDSVSCSNQAILQSPAGVTLTNSGTINSNGSGGGGPRGLVIDLTNNGTVNVNASLDSQSSARTWLNQGALNIADSRSFEWANGTFTNGTAGSITTSGGASTGVFVMRPLSGVFGTFNQGTGTTAGIPLQLEDTNINYTGAGASTITARGEGNGSTVVPTLSGNIAAGQTLNLYADCARHQLRKVTASFTNAGTINIDSASCSNNAGITTPTAVPVLTNTGTINSNATNGGQRKLQIAVTNTGTINVHAPLDAVTARVFNQNGGLIKIDTGKTLNWRGGAFNNNGGTIGAPGFVGKVTGAGLFTQNNGTIFGATVQRGGSVSWTGTGTGRIDVAGTTGTLSGTMVAGQSLNVISSCAALGARNFAANFTNGGTITLKSASCSNAVSLTSSSPSVVLTNNGTITTDPTNGGPRKLSVSITNNGTMNVNQTADSVGNYTFVNSKTVNIANGMTFNWRGGDFTNATSGVINGAGSGTLRLESGSTYHAQNGTTTGTTPVVSDNGNLDFNATGAVGASTIIATGTGGTITGLIRPNQTVNLQSNCTNHTARATTGAFVNNGTLILSSNGCSNITTLDATVGGFTNGGNVIVDESPGTRNLVGNVVNNKTFTLGLNPLNHSGGNFRSNNAASNIVVRVASAGAFGRINSTGAFTLGGKLTINTDAGFWPSAGQDYAILNGSAARTGTFATVVGTTRTGQTVVYQVQYPANGVNLHAF